MGGSPLKEIWWGSPWDSAVRRPVDLRRNPPYDFNSQIRWARPTLLLTYQNLLEKYRLEQPFMAVKWTIWP